MSRPSARPLDVSYISSCYIERRVLLGCGSVFEVRRSTFRLEEEVLYIFTVGVYVFTTINE